MQTPELARFLFVAVSDVPYSDNLDPDGDLRLDISVPEPPTGLLVVTLTGSLMQAARRRIGPSMASRHHS